VKDMRISQIPPSLRHNLRDYTWDVVEPLMMDGAGAPDPVARYICFLV
jgi:hypothetical protein